MNEHLDVTNIRTSVLPQPKSLDLLGGQWVKTHAGHHSTGCRIAIWADPADGLDAQVALLAGYLAEEQMFAAGTASREEADIELLLSLPPRSMGDVQRDAGFSDERYLLTIAPERIRIEAASPAGVAHAIQTLRQLLSGQRARLELPCLVIEDEPELNWRGLHLDVSRHFFDAASVKRFIDLAALHKFSIFHWHLTDDQGWRLPVEGYPKLQEIAAWRTGTLIGHDADRSQYDSIPHGGIYTQEEIRDVVRYAAIRGVSVLPEVDVPGHVQALLAAYPEFGASGERPEVRQHWGISEHVLNLEPATFAFLEAVCDTLADLFPFRYAHVGGDEAKTDQWTASTQIQARKREMGIVSDTDVQRYYTERLGAMLTARGRRMIGWDEIAERGLPANGCGVMYWRDSMDPDPRLGLLALKAGCPVVLANWSRTYFDLYQARGTDRDAEPLAICGQLPLDDVYNWRPLEQIPANLQSGVLGGQAQHWTEYIETRNYLDYMSYPRGCALSQVLWTGPTREPWEHFESRLANHLHRLDLLQVSYRPTR